MVNGKQKGNSFEREVAGIFSKRFQTYTGVEESFLRNLDSGSRFGGNNRIRSGRVLKEDIQVGDIITPERFKFVIECKNYKFPFSVKALLKQQDSDLDSWITQVTEDSKVAKKLPLLIIRYNYLPTMALTTVYFYDQIFRYKDFYGYTLDRFLSCKDNDYFSSK